MSYENTRPGSFVDPSFMLMQLGERRNEIDKMQILNSNIDQAGDNNDQQDGAENTQGAQKLAPRGVDPFLLLKEVAEMSKHMNQAKSIDDGKPDEFQMKCQMNLANYNSMVANNFDKMAETDKNVSDLANKYNPMAL